MIRYITRHGQIVASADYWQGQHMFPLGEPPLSELGREQARLLGEHLKKMQFQGRIISSPYRRTMETAEIIAEIVDAYILPYWPIREMFTADERAGIFEGLSLKELQEMYPRIAPDAELMDRWWLQPYGVAKGETLEEVTARVRDGVARIEELFPDEEILYVGHGASQNALVKVYGFQRERHKLGFNCQLSWIDPWHSEIKSCLFDVSHMPYEMTTSNALTREQYDAEYFAKPWPEEIPLPEGFNTICGQKVLHIGDTKSVDYPYYRKLIEVVQPDVILHTGDIADEVKVGRIPEVRYEYICKIKTLLQIMEESKARLIIVPGNNDLPEEIARLVPRAEIYPEDAVLELDGVSCRVGHRVQRTTFDQKWSFYGHGPTGDSWRYEDNIPGQPCRFNAFFGSYVCSLKEDKFFYFPHP